MATKATTTASRAKAKWDAQSIADAYIRELLTHGKAPASVFAFTDKLGIAESEFYKFYSSFEALETEVWHKLMTTTIDTLMADEKFASFSAREKLLAFFYTHLEVLKDKRSYVAMRWPQNKLTTSTPKMLKAYRESFHDFRPNGGGRSPGKGGDQRPQAPQRAVRQGFLVSGGLCGRVLDQRFEQRLRAERCCRRESREPQLPVARRVSIGQRHRFCQIHLAVEISPFRKI
jgi:hypothetical protein